MKIRTENNKYYRKVELIKFKTDGVAEITFKDETGSYLTIEVKTKELAAIIEE